jgi:hypothetical protein
VTERERACRAPTEPPSDDGVRWLALLLLEGLMVIVAGIRRRYGLSAGAKCPKCRWEF